MHVKMAFTYTQAVGVHAWQCSTLATWTFVNVEIELTWANSIFFKTPVQFEHFFLRSFARFCARFALFCARFARTFGCKKFTAAESVVSCEVIVEFQQLSITCRFLQELLSEGLHCSKPTVWNHRVWVIHHVTENCHHVSIQPGIFHWQRLKQFLVRQLNIRIVFGPYKPHSQCMQQHKFMQIALQHLSSVRRWVHLRCSKGPTNVFQSQVGRSLA